MRKFLLSLGRMLGFLSSLALMLRFWKALFSAVIAKGGAKADLRRVLADKALRDKLVCTIVPNGGDPFYRVVVDYQRSFYKMVVAGHYANVDSRIYDEFDGSNITDIFPIKGRGKVEREVVLVRPNKRASIDEVFAEIARRGLRSARPEELLAFGAQFPDVQEQFWIVSLDFIWRTGWPSSDLLVAVLEYYEYFCIASQGGRFLRASKYDDVRRGVEGEASYYHDYRFLAVRKGDKSAETPAKIKISGRVYKNLRLSSFLRKGEYFHSDSARTLADRAKEAGAILGQEDGEFLLAHQGELPIGARACHFVFMNWFKPDDPESVACIRWCRDDNRWVQDWHPCSKEWDYYHWVFRRKA